MDNKLKLLVAGNVKGQYSKLFKRVSDVNKKAGPFDLILCVGDFFSEETEAYNALITGSIDFPNVPTYVLGPIPKQLLKYHPNVDSFDQGCELTDGVTYLGRSGMLTTSQGLRIAYLNGSFREEDIDDGNLNYFTIKEYESLTMAHQASSDVVDILLTTQWPKHVFNYTSIDLDESVRTEVEQTSSTMISKLCATLRPRYHFVGNVNVFLERAPFRNHRVLNETARNVTRVISVADVQNNQKMKWIYAFNIVPAKHLEQKELIAQPDGVTENPFLKTMAESNERQAQSEGFKQFFYDMSSDQSHSQNDKERKRFGDRKNGPPRKQMKVDLENCWFCLASPKVDKTLIVSIGEFSYLALSKGGLTDEHLMILPIEHIRSTVEIEEDGLREEIDKFKQALKQFYQKSNMVPVFFERNFRSAHFQIQVIGLPESKASALKDTVAEVFRNIEYHELPLDSELDDVISSGIPYFYFDCPEHYKFFVRINVKREFFPIQIGRELLAHKTLLDCPDRVDWKRVASNDAKDLCKSIRDSFKPFDFTL